MLLAMQSYDCRYWLPRYYGDGRRWGWEGFTPRDPPPNPDPLGLVGCLDDLRTVNPCYGGNPGYRGNGSQWRPRAPSDARYYVTKQVAGLP